MSKKLFLIAASMFSTIAFADVQYFNGKVERIESCVSAGGITAIFFKDIVGTVPTSLDGCSNDISLPYVRINHTTGQMSEFEKQMMSLALSAQATEREVRVRYDDQTLTLQSIAID